MKNKLIRFVSSCGYIGYVPYAGGSFASLLGVLIYLAVAKSNLLYLTITIFLVIVGFFVSPSAERLFGVKDSPRIVIDELAATLIVFFRIPPTFRLLTIGFIIFRLLDIIKPYPADRAEDAKSWYSVMTDDLIVALYTNIVLHLVISAGRIL